MMNSASSALAASAGATSMRPPAAPGLVGRDEKGVAQLVRHHDRPHLFEIAQLDDLLVHRDGRDRVEPRGRLIVQEDARLRRHGPGDGDPPALAARELRWPPIDVLRKTHEPQHFLHARANLGERPVHLLVELEADVLADRERIEERALLEHHAQPAPHPKQVALLHLIHALAAHVHLAGVGPEQPQNQLEDRGLAGAAGTEDQLRVPRQQGEADVAQHHLVVEGQRHVPQLHGRRVGGGRASRGLRLRRGVHGHRRAPAVTWFAAISRAG